MALEPVGAQGEFGDEARGRFRLARFIMEAGVKLGLGSLAVATACAAFHRWARAAGPGAPHDPHLMAAAAIFLAAKAQGTPLRARDVLNVTHRLLHPGQPPPGPEGGFWGLRDSLVQCELLLLRVLRFRVPVAHPHKYLVQYLLALGRWGGRRGGWGPRRVPGVSWALVRDGAAGGLALRHPPQHLAAAALHLALALCGRHPPPGGPPEVVAGSEPRAGPLGAGADPAGAPGSLQPGRHRRGPPTGQTDGRTPAGHTHPDGPPRFSSRDPRGGQTDGHAATAGGQRPPGGGRTHRAPQGLTDRWTDTAPSLLCSVSPINNYRRLIIQY